MIRVVEVNDEKYSAKIRTWWMDEWGEIPDEGSYIFCAIKNDEAIGTVVITDYDLPNSEYTPWLAYVYVELEHRGKGVARLMIDHALKFAKSNCNNIYLFTHDAAAMYESLGFIELRPDIFKGRDITIMSKHL